MNTLENLLKYKNHCKVLHLYNEVKFIKYNFEDYSPEHIKNLFVFEFSGAAFDMAFLLDDNFDLHGIYQCRTRICFIKPYYNLFNVIDDFTKEEIVEYITKICRKEAIKLGI